MEYISIFHRTFVGRSFPFLFSLQPMVLVVRFLTGSPLHPPTEAEACVFLDFKFAIVVVLCSVPGTHAGAGGRTGKTGPGGHPEPS